MEYTTKTMQFDSGVNLVHSPVLSDEEREGRRQQLKKAATCFLKRVEQERAEKHRQLEA